QSTSRRLLLSVASQGSKASAKSQRYGKRERRGRRGEWCPKKYPARITRREETAAPPSRRRRGPATLSYSNCFRAIFARAAPIADFTSFSSSGGGSTAGMPSDSIHSSRP